ncbi:MAG TPA: alpha-ketoglutarate-dependent dioxygenase AlkB [Casimicrobiaceae bacterium]
MKQVQLFEPDTPLPDGLVYVRDFLTGDEERALLAHIATLDFHAARYKAYTAKRRVVSYGSSYDFGDNALREAPPVPEFLQPLRAKAAAWVGLPAEDFADALIAEYAPGTQLGWHRDVPDFEDVVGVSLAGECRMRFRPYPLRANKREGVFAVTLEARSAYALRRDVRWRWQHMIAPTPMLRYSITFRTRKGRRRA